jgi:hypothetical protein
MNKTITETGDATLGKVLRESRSTPALPPRFQEGVWRRIEQNQSPAAISWVEALAVLVLRPRFAIAAVCGLALLGALLGAWEGSVHARQVAQSRYVESVAMTLSH